MRRSPGFVLVLAALAAMGLPTAVRSQGILPVQSEVPCPFSSWPRPLQVAALEETAGAAADGAAPWCDRCFPCGVSCVPWWRLGQSYLADELDKLLHDFQTNYRGPRLACLGLALAVAAPLANSDADVNFRNWYQRQARSPGSDEAAKVANWFGGHWHTVPILLGAAVGGRWLRSEWDEPGYIETWGERSLRAMIVGAPAVGLLQVGLGAGRPNEGSSHWRPFHDNNAVAGHGFIGAVPFLAAATVVESRPLKVLFFAGSFATPWARIHQDAHFLSQAVLGWSIAYLAVQSVYDTDLERRRLSFVPIDLPDGAGIGVRFRF